MNRKTERETSIAIKPAVWQTENISAPVYPLVRLAKFFREISALSGDLRK